MGFLYLQNEYLFTLLIALSTLISYGQNFEGKITYKNDYKNTKIGDELYTRIAGDTQQYFYKNGNYKSITNGTLSQWQLHLANGYKIYNQLNFPNKIFWTDVSKNDDSIISVTISKNKETILGYVCDEMIFETKKRTQKYYYNHQLSVNPKLFSNHKYFNWYDYVLRAKALPLKSIIETDDFILTSIAIEVQRIKLEDNLFALPENVELEEMPLPQ